uniref:Nerve growth factor-related domain-containing protein n=1 Tax=Mola mola TaxID=94237 RepID=A0A3Q3WMR2_MOLML
MSTCFHRHRLSQFCLFLLKCLSLHSELGPESDFFLPVLEGDEMLEAHPRVLFSPSPPEHPPFLLMLETAGDATELLHPIKRDKRSHLMDRRRGEKSVCEAESVWVTNKTTAVDSYNVKVTILQEIQTQTGPLKQFFYEKAKQSFVRALTKDANNRVGWRWIRIDSSCVCVLLSRANQAAGREVLSRMGRG